MIELNLCIKVSLFILDDFNRISNLESGNREALTVPKAAQRFAVEPGIDVVLTETRNRKHLPSTVALILEPISTQSHPRATRNRFQKSGIAR